MTDLYEANGVRFIASDDMIIAWERREDRAFEPVTTAWMQDVMQRREGLFVDVGASTGWFTVAFLAAGFQVCAVEPNPKALARLRENLALNGVSCRLIEAAASRFAGRATFHYNPRVPLTSGGSVEAPTCGRPAQLQVRTVRLDDEIGDPVALIKIDVEGHERSVLDGAREIIARDRPHLVLEANTERHFANLGAWLDQNGYAWTRADDRNMLCNPRS